MKVDPSKKLIIPLTGVQTRVLDEKRGLVEYVASDESLDHYREIVSARGWRFNFFKRNPAFVNSHDYSTLENSLGKIVEFGVVGRRLIETAQWAVDVEENRLAQLGFRMTAAGYTPAVSVGFFPVRWASKWDNNGDDLAKAARELGLDTESAAKVSTIYLEQEQIELSACVIGANPSALAKAYKDGLATDDDLDFVARTISAGHSANQTARAATDAADAARVRQQRERQDAFLRKIQNLTKQIK